MCLKSQPPDVGASGGNAHPKMYVFSTGILYHLRGSHMTFIDLPDSELKMRHLTRKNTRRGLFSLTSQIIKNQCGLSKNSCNTKIENPHKHWTYIMEYTGFEPVASTMRMWRAPSCANTPKGTPKGSMEATGLEPMTSR